MSNLKKLLAERVQRHRKNMTEFGRILCNGNAVLDDFERAKRRYIIAFEDRTWALRGFSGQYRPRVGKDIADPPL